MMLTYDRLGSSDLRGFTRADVLVAVDAELRIKAGSDFSLVEPGFPVVELARAIRIWLDSQDRQAFAFDSMSFEERGSVSIVQTPTGWRFESMLEPGVVSDPLPWDEVEEELRRFILQVGADLANLGIDAGLILG